MNILFITPLNEPYEVIINASKADWKSKSNVHKNIKKISCAYPTGLLSISAYLKKHAPDTNIKILDFNAFMIEIAKKKYENSEDFENYPFQKFLEDGFSLIEDFNPDIIGISTLFCSNYRDLSNLASFLRSKYPKSLIICGGHMASSLYERVYKDNIEIDAIAFGEGEIPLLELIKSYSFGGQSEYLISSPCWITKEKIKSGSKFIPQNKVITNLDEIPPFDLGVLVFPEAYFDSVKYFFGADLKEYFREVFIFSTRGCPFNCIFCASQAVHGHRVRAHSIERIKEDILYYHQNYNIKRFIFFDDHFLLDKKRAIEILNFISQNKFIAEIPTPAFFSIDDDIALAMKRAGIKVTNITIENGNENTLKNIINKPGDLKRAEETVNSLHKAGIIVISNILTGFPGETKEAIEEGFKYLKTTNIDWFSCHVVAPLPGSRMYKLCEEKGYLINGYDVSTTDFKTCLIKTEDFTPEYIEKKVYEMNLTLNFVNNYNMRIGNYETALRFFERIINSIIDTHAFAYYFAAKCCKELHLEDKYKIYKEKYYEMITKYPVWKEYAAQFNLQELG